MLKLIVGLGNPEDNYAKTRHNAGFWLVQALAAKHNILLSHQKKYRALVGTGVIFDQKVHLMLPQTYMNRSGEAVAPFMHFYQIKSTEVLVAHDELDINIGQVRLKNGGGHGGHNGLKDIARLIGADFLRLRIGIGRPSNKDVTAFVLGAPSVAEKNAIDTAILHAIDHAQPLIHQEFNKAATDINGFDALKL